MSCTVLQDSADQSDPEATSYVLMYYYCISIWLHTRLNLTETGYDRFTPEFRELIHHADLYVTAKAEQRPAFTFEVGAVPVLYFAASKCRVASLRRKALDLLTKAPGKEFTFGARTTAELIRRLIGIEEVGLELPGMELNGHSASLPINDTLVPSEDARVHNLELLKNNITNRHEVRITTYSESNGRLFRHTDDVPL